MKSTRYFEEQMLRKRPYIERSICLAVVAAPLPATFRRTDAYAIGGAVVDACDGKQRILRVVTLEDGETIHNAFFDRDFRKDEP